MHRSYQTTSDQTNEIAPDELAAMRESAERLAEWLEDASSRYDEPISDDKILLFATNRHTLRKTEVTAGDIRGVIALCRTK